MGSSPALHPQRSGDETTSTDEKPGVTAPAVAGEREEKSGTSTPPRLQPPELISKLTAEEREQLEKKLKRKIDLRLLPAVIIMYIMNYIDRNNIAAARLAGLERDLKLTSTEFQTAVSILFVG
ncbi:hypothetical protein VTJ49DRAFT_6052 [Mycothermus thermophilus]|uniref:Uncharacterized protein n=1 Tax=Humicola insolens TaxID=85995 RepID=A0ABR3V3D6_HUMIN